MTKKYGISLNRTQLTGSEVLSRYSSEASAGRVRADVLGLSCGSFDEQLDIFSKGWATPAKDLGIPGLDGKDILVGDGAAFKYYLTPVVLGINTDKLSGSKAPTSWEDLLKPEYKDKIVMVDPTASYFFDQWLQWVDDEFGDDYLEALGKQNLRYADPATARNQVSAGQSEIIIPTFQVSVNENAATGAPLGGVLPDKTTANESCIAVSSSDEAPHPAAALLFAHFITTEEGAKALTEGPKNGNGVVLSPFAGGGVPDFVSPLPTNIDSAKLHELIGFKG